MANTRSVAVLVSLPARAASLLAPVALVMAGGCTSSPAGDSPSDLPSSANPSDPLPAMPAAPSGPAGAPAPAECGDVAELAQPRIWRLTKAQLANTLRSAFGVEPEALANLPGEARLDGFANQASQLRIAPLLAEVYFAIGDELGIDALANPARFGITCDVANLARGSCLDGFIAGPNGEGDWIVMDPSIDFAAMYKEFDTAVMGRKTYR